MLAPSNPAPHITARLLCWIGQATLLVILSSPVFAQGPAKPADLVKAEAHLSVDRLPAGSKCQILIRLTIDPKWHIGANPKANEDDIPTEVEWKSKHGTKLVQVKYPVGKKYTPEGGDTQRIYDGKDGKVDIRGVLEIPASAAETGEETVEILVNYQACDDSICHRPTTVKLVAKLPVAKPGEPVKQINEKHFAPPK